MIETLVAKNGGKVLRYQGRLLSSAFDPQSEAADWLERRRNLTDQVKTIFVLGAGSGYHILALVQNTAAKILVIEYSAELITAVEAIHAFNHERVQFECVEKAKSLRSSEKVRAAVLESFLVLQHPPTIATEPDFYRDCRNQLLGRDWGSLNWQWQLKGFAPLDSQPKIHATEEPLTIHDLDKTELVSNSGERERMLMKALRELVK